MIVLPLSYLSDAMQQIAKTTVETESMYIDPEARIGLIAANDELYWVYIWFVESDPDDAAACNKEFQDKMEVYIETVKDF